MCPRFKRVLCAAETRVYLAVMTLERGVASARYARARLLGILGVIVVLVSAVVAIGVKRSADRAAIIANAGKRLVSCGSGSNSLSLCFPKPDHVPVAPHYSGLVLPVIACALGVLIVISATIAAVRARRTA